MKSFVFSTIKSIISEVGGVTRLSTLCRQHNITTPLIVTDKGIINNGLLTHVFQSLKEDGLFFQCFDDVVADPSEALILSAVDFAKKHAIDGVIGFGGGS